MPSAIIAEPVKSELSPTRFNCPPPSLDNTPSPETAVKLSEPVLTVYSKVPFSLITVLPST